VHALHVAAEDLAGTRSVAADALATRIPNACTNTRVWVSIYLFSLSLSLSNVLRRAPIYAGLKSRKAIDQKSNMECSPGHSWATRGGD
jgi:hypothetical protein